MHAAVAYTSQAPRLFGHIFSEPGIPLFPRHVDIKGLLACEQRNGSKTMGWSSVPTPVLFNGL